MSRVLSEAATNRETATFPTQVAARWHRAATGLAALLAAATLLAPVSAQATTVRLDTDAGWTLVGYSSDALLLAQNGFSYQSSIAYGCFGCFLHLHDDSGILESTISSVDGYRFDARDFNVGADRGPIGRRTLSDRRDGTANTMTRTP